MASGFGAKSAAISMLPVPMRRPQAFSHVQPPCIAVETITAGKATCTRGSMALRTNVCVPPPLAPVTPMRVASTSGSEVMKSRARIEFHACRPIADCRCDSACGLNSPQPCGRFISGRCVLKPWMISGEICWLSALPIMSQWNTTQPMRASCTQRACNGLRPLSANRSAPCTICFLISSGPQS